MVYVMCLNQTNRTIIIVINEKKTENWIKFLVMLANNIFYVAIPYQCHKYIYVCMYLIRIYVALLPQKLYHYTYLTLMFCAWWKSVIIYYSSVTGDEQNTKIKNSKHKCQACVTRGIAQNAKEEFHNNISFMVLNKPVFFLLFWCIFVQKLGTCIHGKVQKRRNLFV